MPKIEIIVGSIRDVRKGKKIADWILEIAKARPEAEFELVDLKEWDLPMMNEPNHPGMRQYASDIAKKWSAKISEAQGFIWVTPEYNHSYPASLKNALDYLYHEWGNKPVAIVSYGGISKGIRASQALKYVLLELKMIPVHDEVNIGLAEVFDENGNIKNDEKLGKSADNMLNELISKLK